MSETQNNPAQKSAQQDGFDWLSPENTAALGARIVAAPGAHLEVRRDDTGGLHFRVAGPSSAAGAQSAETDINDSHRCPPTCPQ